ncbi:MAG: hypothetical protein LiPW16_396 [Microgenomates group bacterium LiPW_16]|nr:MAG: hypothetical protein LiPW16_396 [Microgenomates group bacterium LiPW_16]
MVENRGATDKEATPQGILFYEEVLKPELQAGKSLGPVRLLCLALEKSVLTSQGFQWTDVRQELTGEIDHLPWFLGQGEIPQELTLTISTVDQIIETEKALAKMGAENPAEVFAFFAKLQNDGKAEFLFGQDLLFLAFKDPKEAVRVTMGISPKSRMLKISKTKEGEETNEFAPKTYTQTGPITGIFVIRDGRDEALRMTVENPTGHDHVYTVRANRELEGLIR